MGIQQILRNALPELPKKLALAARYALDHPDQMALNSMRRTSTEVGVTSTTMLRLARQLGFDSYDNFRASFQKELVRGVFGTRADALHQDQIASQDNAATAENLSDRVLIAAEINIRNARATLRQDDLDAVATRLRAATNVYIVGSGALFWLASMMKNTGNMILDNLRLIGTEYSVAAEAMGALGPDDLVIGFGVNPCAQRTVDALQYARGRGAFVVAMTDRPSSPLAEGAEIVLCAETSSPHYYPSIAPLLTIVEALLATVVAKGDGTELQRIQEFETIRRRSGRYTEQ